MTLVERLPFSDEPDLWDLEAPRRGPWPSAEARFAASITVGRPDECWPWTGYVRNGYGSLWLDGRNEYAHRYAFVRAGGTLRPGEQACHRCDNRLCCNPAHLFAGTNAENQADMRAKGRGVPPPHLAGEAHPFAKLTDAQVGEIRHLGRHGLTHQEIAQRVGATRSNVQRILAGRARTSVPDPDDMGDLCSSCAEPGDG